MSPAQRLHVDGNAFVAGSTYLGDSSADITYIQGKVGIGIGSPDCDLHINGANNSEQVIITGNNSASRGLSISTVANNGQNNAGVIFNAQDTEHADYPALIFQTGGTTRASINQYGLGLGTAQSAGYILEAEGAGHARFNLRSSDNNTSGMYFQVKNAGNTTGQATLRTDNTGKFTIFTGTSSEAARVYIDATGRVGINRTPTKSNSKLEVGGADNVGLIHVEASGNFASWGIGSNQSKFYYNDTQMMGLTNIGELKLMGGSTTGRQDIVFSNGNMSIANEATYTLSGVLNTGALVSIGVNRSNVGVTYDHCLIFAETGTAATVVANPSGRIAINSATTANKVNIFVNGSHIVIQNKVASTVAVSVAAFVFQGN